MTLQGSVIIFIHNIKLTNIAILSSQSNGDKEYFATGAGLFALGIDFIEV